MNSTQNHDSINLKTYDLVFAIIAKREVDFFLPIAKRMIAEEGLSVGFVTFHETGDKILQKEGIDYFSIHKLRDSIKDKTYSTDQLKEIEKIIGVRYQRLILHEMLTANRFDDHFLSSKVIDYYSILRKIFKENQIQCIVQELGGFIAPQLLYHVSRCFSVNHVFIEPAMFPKRILFSANTFTTDIPENLQAQYTDTEKLETLLNQYVNQRTVVIPKKDKHFFQDMTLKRLFSADNFRRLFRKLSHKFTGVREEYDAIGWYVWTHCIKWFRRQIYRFRYQSPSGGDKYVYYPFHVPLDVQLTVRCPEFLNQESLVQYIAGCLPAGYMLYIKEHPASIGGHSLSRMKEVLKLKNVKLIHPKYNSFELIKNAMCVTTINSKVGFEAIMQRKPVVVFGHTFYRNKGVTVDLEKLSDLPNVLVQAMGIQADKKARHEFLNKVFEWSYAGELYENSPENLDAFYRSLWSFISDLDLLNTKNN